MSYVAKITVNTTAISSQFQLRSFLSVVSSPYKTHDYNLSKMQLCALSLTCLTPAFCPWLSACGWSVSIKFKWTGFELTAHCVKCSQWLNLLIFRVFLWQCGFHDHQIYHNSLYHKETKAPVMHLNTHLLPILNRSHWGPAVTLPSSSSPRIHKEIWIMYSFLYLFTFISWCHFSSVSLEHWHPQPLLTFGDIWVYYMWWTIFRRTVQTKGKIRTFSWV